MLCSLVFIARTAFIVNGEYYFTRFDDAMISIRYARNPAAGQGLVWNASQAPVEDYAYSIGELRPDVVDQLRHATDDDVRRIESWG